MGLLVSHTDFTGMLSVGLSPDTGADTLTREAETDLLDSYIDVYEREYLHDILGEKVCNEFLDYLQRENPEDSKEEKWEKLKELLQVSCGPVACYVYFHYIRDCGRSVTRSGVVKSSADDEIVSPSPLQIRAWNLMASENCRVFDLLMGDEYEGVVFNKYMIESINDLGI